MNLFRVVYVAISTSILLFSATSKMLCIEDSEYYKVNSCNGVDIDKNIDITTVTFNSKITIEERVFTIQDSIKKITNDEGKEYPNLIIYAKGINAALAAVAYHNLSRDYQKSVEAFILENTPLNIYKNCFSKSRKERRVLEYCNAIDGYYKELKLDTSLYEISNALDPAIQRDWYFPNTLYIDTKSNKDRRDDIDKISLPLSLNYNYYFAIDKQKIELEINRYLKFVISNLQSKRVVKSTLGSYYPLIRLHLGKILYRPTNKLSKEIDQPYAEGELQKFDIYYKKESNNNSLFIYVHGGGWSGGDKSQFRGYAKYYADIGFSAAVVNYRLLGSKDIHISKQIDDVKRVIEYLINNASKYRANSQKTVVMGDSAGAQLLFMAISKMDKSISKGIKLVLLNSMSSDLTLYPKNKQIKLSGVNDDKKRLEWLHKYSPIYHLDNFNIPILAIHSIDDTLVTFDNLKKLDLETVKSKNKITTIFIKGASHPISATSCNLIPSYKKTNSIIMSNINLFTDKSK